MQQTTVSLTFYSLEFEFIWFFSSWRPLRLPAFAAASPLNARPIAVNFSIAINSNNNNHFPLLSLTNFNFITWAIHFVCVCVCTVPWMALALAHSKALSMSRMPQHTFCIVRRKHTIRIFGVDGTWHSARRWARIFFSHIFHGICMHRLATIRSFVRSFIVSLPNVCILFIYSHGRTRIERCLSCRIDREKKKWNKKNDFNIFVRRSSRRSQLSTRNTKHVPNKSLQIKSVQSERIAYTSI